MEESTQYTIKPDNIIDTSWNVNIDFKENRNIEQILTLECHVYVSGQIKYIKDHHLC